MTTQPTYDDVNLILRLYELRREEKIRAARAWFISSYHARTLEEHNALCPLGSDHNAYFRMVVSYWDMAASFVTAGVLNQELFLESGRELLFVWERIREVVPHLRQAAKNLALAGHLETLANAAIKKMNSQGPESYAAFQAMVHRTS
ncbi:MAG: hypothetical protein HY238_17615 [Acidobacteria bacterium]|nr:hypothetical protein [Acidobacteriota bacterium]